MRRNGINPRTTNIVLVDDQPIIALGCQEVFGADDGFFVVHAASLAEARVAINLMEIATLISVSYQALSLECVRFGYRFGVRSLLELRRIGAELQIV